MKYNLENIPFSDVINDKQISYAEFRKELQPDFSKIIRDLGKGYIFLLLILVIDTFVLRGTQLNPILVMIFSSMVIGYILAYLHLFIHEAAHYNIHPDKIRNDQLSDYFIGIFFGIAVSRYRKIHWLHHQKLGSKDDSENSYFNELNIIFLLKNITGIHALSVIFSRFRTLKPIKQKGSELNYIFISIIFHLGLITILFFSAGWFLVGAWLIGLLIIFPSFAAIRQLLEHRDSKASKSINYREVNHGKITRLFGDNLVDSSFGAAGFNKHLIHHWDPVISYTRLKDVENFLMDCATTAAVVKASKSNYLQTFFALFKS